ncbi:MAG: N-acetylmuramoyl-L-alanine amidase family protein [Planctomycetota bacterium]
MSIVIVATIKPEKRTNMALFCGCGIIEATTMKKITATTAGLLLIAIIMIGCESPGKVLDPLPKPYVHSPAQPGPGKTHQETIEPAQQPKLPLIGKPTVVVDAGHGGEDPGAWKETLSRMPEKTIVLAIARELTRVLKERGAKVVMTRYDDRYIKPERRAAIAEYERADLLVSLHADSDDNHNASGVGLFIARNASRRSKQAETKIRAGLKRAGFTCRKLQRKGFEVLAGHSRPAVLIECGFLSNTGDAKKLNSPAYRSRLAAAIADGIIDHFNP